MREIEKTNLADTWWIKCYQKISDVNELNITKRRKKKQTSLYLMN